MLTDGRFVPKHRLGDADRQGHAARHLLSPGDAPDDRGTQFFNAGLVDTAVSSIKGRGAILGFLLMDADPSTNGRAPCDGKGDAQRPPWRRASARSRTRAERAVEGLTSLTEGREIDLTGRYR